MSEHDSQKVTTAAVIETKPAPFPAPPGTMEQRVTIIQTSTPLKQFGRWSAGLIAGFIRGGAHAVTSGTVIQVMDPAAFNGAILRYGILFVFHGVISTMLYLQSHPLPDEWLPGASPERRKENGQ